LSHSELPWFEGKPLELRVPLGPEVPRFLVFF